jgi:hypothetical protein
LAEADAAPGAHRERLGEQCEAPLRAQPLDGSLKECGAQFEVADGGCGHPAQVCPCRVCAVQVVDVGESLCDQRGVVDRCGPGNACQEARVALIDRDPEGDRGQSLADLLLEVAPPRACAGRCEKVERKVRVTSLGRALGGVRHSEGLFRDAGNTTGTHAEVDVPFALSCRRRFRRCRSRWRRCSSPSPVRAADSGVSTNPTAMTLTRTGLGSGAKVAAAVDSPVCAVTIRPRPLARCRTLVGTPYPRARSSSAGLACVRRCSSR